MKTSTLFSSNSVVFFLVLLLFPNPNFGSGSSAPFPFQVSEYKGIVVNTSGDPLPSAVLSVEGSNISSVTNADGEFSIKIPDSLPEARVSVSHMGYESRILPLEFFQREEVVIELSASVQELAEINILTYTNPVEVVRNMLQRRGANYFEQRANMTAFYRETIRRGRRNVSLSEAVVTIHKTPYTSKREDDISLVKARKTADYDRLDTVALKLRGGPYNPLRIDLVKNPTYIFGQNGLESFEFEFDEPTQLNARHLYVVKFKEKQEFLPWYYGTLYIDGETFALVKASFELNVDNRSAATDLFVKKKPGGTRVYPVSVHYDIQYRERDGRWYYGYGNTRLEFVVNWKRRLFNSRYKVNSEMAITNWKTFTGDRIKKNRDFLSESVIMADDITGFADRSFWGENNIIEPEKSIENAIEKIRERLEDQ